MSVKRSISRDGIALIIMHFIFYPLNGINKMCFNLMIISLEREQNISSYKSMEVVALHIVENKS